ncbi:MAG: class I SAM-dependent methyltransferase [Lentimicrobiaceae bacterium]|nr:class I SAM-dependent methyltransferase [Lentimicrobiaceae bacterium]
MDKQPTSAGIARRFAAKGIFPYQMAFTLLIPLRNIFLSPKEFIRRLELKSDSVVLEVGPGPGYFSRPLARFLSGGKLVLADIQQEMLDYARKRLNRKGLKNVDYYLCDGLKFHLQDMIFDRIFLITVIGEVENREAYMAEFYRMLKPGGLLSISELAGDPDKMTMEEVTALAEAAGFSAYRFYGNKKNYTVNFLK